MCLTSILGLPVTDSEKVNSVPSDFAPNPLAAYCLEGVSPIDGVGEMVRGTDARIQLNTTNLTNNPLLRHSISFLILLLLIVRFDIQSLTNKNTPSIGELALHNSRSLTG